MEQKCWYFSTFLRLYLLFDFPFILVLILQYFSWLWDSELLLIWVPESQKHQIGCVFPYDLSSHLRGHLLWLFPFEDPLFVLLENVCQSGGCPIIFFFHELMCTSVLQQKDCTYFCLEITF